MSEARKRWKEGYRIERIIAGTFVDAIADEEDIMMFYGRDNIPTKAAEELQARHTERYAQTSEKIAGTYRRKS